MQAKHIIKSDRVCRAITGLNINKFERLLENFTWTYNQETAKEHKQKGCTNKLGQGRKGRFKNIQDKLILILFFFKVYPTEDVAGVFFDVDGSSAGKQIRKLRKILEFCSCWFCK